MSKYQKYPQYKDSGMEWLGAIPENWEVKKLKFIAYAKPSNVDKKSKDGEKGVLLCNYTDVYYNDFITNKIEFMKATATDEQIKKFTLNVNDVIITKDSEGPEDIAIATCVKEVQNNLVCGYHLTHIKPTKCNGRYLFRAFNSEGIHDQFKVAANGITRYGIGVYGIDNSFFPTPPMEEQQSIANYLDKATTKIDTLIEKQTKLIELLKEKRQAVISTAVTRGLDSSVPMKDSGVEWLGEIAEHWEIKKLKHIGESIIGLTYSPNNIVDEHEGTLVLRSSNLQDGGLYYGDNVYVNSAIPNKLITKNGDIVICSRNGSRKLIGKNAMIDKQSAGVSFGAFTSVFRSKQNPFVFYILNSSLFKYQSGRFMTTTINQLTTGTLNEFQIALPLASEQSEIVNYLDDKTSKIDTLVIKATKAIELLKERRTALISAVVTGKIDVRGNDNA